MGNLVLKTTAIYAAYLTGYLAATAENAFDAHVFDDDAPSDALARMAAYALGDHDRNAAADGGAPLSQRQPRELREVLPIVRRMIEAEPSEAPTGIKASEYTDTQLSAIVSGVLLGSFTSGQYIFNQVFHAVPVEHRNRLRQLCDKRAEEHNATLE